MNSCRTMLFYAASAQSKFASNNIVERLTTVSRAACRTAKLRFRHAFGGHQTPVRKIAVYVSLIAMIAGGARAQEHLLTAEDIRAIAPNAGEEFIAAMVNAEAEFDAAGINTRLRMAHFIGQVMTETGGLRRIDENMNYSYASLMRVFSRRTVSEQDARRIARNPRQVANWVYGARLGNRGRDTNDGWNYRGSGFIQLTGRDNFIRRGAEIDVAKHPRRPVAMGP